MGRDRTVSSAFTVPIGVMMPSACPPQWVSAARPPCVFPGETEYLPIGYACHAPSVLVLQEQSRAFSSNLSSPQGEEPSLIRFLPPTWGKSLLQHCSLPDKGGEAFLLPSLLREGPWSMPDNALPGDGAIDAELSQRQSLIFLLGVAGHAADAGTPCSRATTEACAFFFPFQCICISSF
jgi:hypothetical protein